MGGVGVARVVAVAVHTLLLLVLRLKLSRLELAQDAALVVRVGRGRAGGRIAVQQSVQGCIVPHHAPPVVAAGAAGGSLLSDQGGAGAGGGGGSVGGGGCRHIDGRRLAVTTLHLVLLRKQFRRAVPQHSVQLGHRVPAPRDAHRHGPPDHRALQRQLARGDRRHPLLHRGPRHEAVHHDGGRLAVPVGAGGGLAVGLGVPVGIENNHCVCAHKIQAQPTRPRGQQEERVAGRVSRKRVDGGLAGGAGGVAVEARRAVAARAVAHSARMSSAPLNWE